MALDGPCSVLRACEWRASVAMHTGMMLWRGDTCKMKCGEHNMLRVLTQPVVR